MKRQVSSFSLILALIIFLSHGNDVLAEGNSPDSSEKTPYTIKKGDTLWDLSEEHLKNPFLWPYIWERNRYIRNPDLIYPGRLLVIPYGIFLMAPKTEEAERPGAPAEPETESESEDDVWSLVPTPEPAPPAPAQEVSITPSPPPPPEAISPPEPVSPPVPQPEISEVKESMEPVSPSTILQRGGMEMTALIHASGYISDSIESSGVITGSPEEKRIYADGDPVNLLLKDTASVGERFTIFLPPAPVIHPKTEKRVGMLFVPVGEMEITGVQGRNATGRVTKSYTNSSQGDHIQPYKPLVPPDETVEKVPDLSGYIIGSHEGKILNAEFDIIYLDRGASDGVIPGATFYVMGGEHHDVIGELKVISVQATTSTALVIRSTGPIDIGSEIVTTIK